MDQSKIYGSGSVLGPQIVSTRELICYAGLDRLGCSPDIIEETMGITHVRHCEESVMPGDLATEAAMNALTAANVSPNEIDVVIYCGIERNCTEPATAHFIADAIGIGPDKLQHCFDVSNACHGFTAGVQIARAFLASQPDEVRYALVCTGERSSGKTKVICDDFRNGVIGKKDIADTLGAFSVGDAGGAMVIGRSENGQGILEISNSNSPRYAKLCHFTNFGLDRGIKPRYAMKMGPICARTKKIIKAMVPDILNRLSWQPKDIDHGIFHQVGRRVHEDWTQILGIDEQRAPSTYATWGNLASANLPVIWDSLAKKNLLKTGEKVFIISAGSGIAVSMIGIHL